MWSSDPDFETSLAYKLLIGQSSVDPDAPPGASNTPVEKPNYPDLSLVDDLVRLPGLNLSHGDMTVGVDWYRAVTLRPLEDLLAYLADRTGFEPVALDRGGWGYDHAYVVGSARVYCSPSKRPETMIDCTGTACAELGFLELRLMHNTLELRASRFDAFVDNCPFTPLELRGDWMADNVRTRVKKLDPDAVAAQGYVIKPEYEGVRRCGLHDSATGDTFTMGSRSSEQYARCYDRRSTGTRFELELKRRRAAAAADKVFGCSDVAVPSVIIGLIRDFVDFVDASVVDDSHRSRAPLLEFWVLFVAGIERAKLVLDREVSHSMDRTLTWLVRQVAPDLAAVDRFDSSLLRRIIDYGRGRWTFKHFDIMTRSSAAEAHAHLSRMIERGELAMGVQM